jgi:hypothetical protein
VRAPPSSAALLLALAGCTGCTLSTSVVHVRDNAQVTLESLEGAPLLPPGTETTDAHLADGAYWVPPFRKVTYEIRGQREPDGAIALRCDACLVSHLPLLRADGEMLPAYSWRVGYEPSRITSSYEDACLEPAQRGLCDARAPVRLTVPREDVVDVRRRSTPVRAVGYLFAGVSVIALGMFTAVALRDHDAAPYAAVAAIPFLAFGGVGLWQLLAPVKEEVWTP